MTNEDNLIDVANETTLDTQPPTLPTVAPKPGYQTTQFHLTALFALAAMVLSWFGIKTDAEQIGNIYEMIARLIESLGPIIAVIPVIITYINSRGKTYSNAINSTAAMNTAVQLGGLGSLLGGKNWKDPKRYLNIGELVAKSGIIPGPAGAIVDKVLGDDDEENGQIVEILNNHEERISRLEK